MRRHPIILAALSVLLAACGKPAATPVTTAISAKSETPAEASTTETARLNDWFEVKFNQAVSRSPMTATFLGSRENYDKWDDVSAAAQDAELAIQRADFDEMQARFDFDDLTAQGKLSWRLAEYRFQQAARADKWRGHAYTFNQMFGAQSRIPSFLIAQHKITSQSDAEAYIARLKGIETYLGQHLDNAETAANAGIRPPLFVYDYVINDARNLVTGYPFGYALGDGTEDSPLMADIRGKLQALIADGTLTGPEAGGLLFQAEETLKSDTGPAYRRLISYLERDRAKADTQDGAWKLPDGAAYYRDCLAQMTTTEMSAADIHQLGLSEVARIHDEMRTIMTEVGFAGDLQAFFEFTRTGAQFFKPETAEGRAEYLAEATALIDTMETALPSVFNTFPQAELDVRAVEAFREKSAGKAFYSRPAPDGSRPGIYYANLYSMANMPTYQMEALAYHEGIPGHHMQLAISQELQGLPKFRKFGGYTAYTEGWGLYSEFLPKEMGFYQDPYSDFGRLAMELWRAARLVVDTGLHDKRWTRQEAIDYLMTNTPNPEGDAIKAIERYIVMPGQATAYKIGMLKIQGLREAAKAELGENFDIRKFHDVVLKDGPVPLAILEENVEAWVAAMKAPN